MKASNDWFLRKNASKPPRDIGARWVGHNAGGEVYCVLEDRHDGRKLRLSMTAAEAVEWSRQLAEHARTAIGGA